MTVANDTNKVRLEGDGSATSFSFSPMVIRDADHLEVTTVDTDGNETVRVEGTGSSQYTVVVASYPGTGSVTYPSSGSTRLAADEFISMRRVVDDTQDTDLENQGGYFPEVQEAQYDLFAMKDLQHKEELDRCIKIPVTDAAASLILPSAANRANQVLAFGATGDVTVTAPTTAGDAVVSSFMETVLDDTTAGAARTTLGAASLSANEFDDKQTIDVAANTDAIVVETGSTSKAKMRVSSSGNGLIEVRDSAGTVTGQWDGADGLMYTVDGVDTFKAHPILQGLDATSTSGSGTAINVTGIRSDAIRITIMFVGLTTDGTEEIIIQLGDAGGIETSGYVVNTASITGATASETPFTSGIAITEAGVAADSITGSIILNKFARNSDTWIVSGNLLIANGGVSIATVMVAGRKATSAALDRIRITTTGVPDDFDGGTISVLVE